MKYLMFISLLLGSMSCTESSSDHSKSESSDKAQNAEGRVAMLEDSKEEEGEESDSDSPKTWKRSQKGINEATLMIGDDDFISPKGAKIALQVDGFRARVLIDYMFYSDYDYMLEGTFKMKLPQGASPYYFAFGESVKINKDSVVLEDKIAQEKYHGDIDLSIEGIERRMSDEWTTPKIARVVEKEKANLAYGNTVRRRIDPALAEWAGADVFNFNVYPLNPKTMHRVVIGYDVDLTEIGNDQVLNFSVPQLEGPLVLDAQVKNIPGIKTVLPDGVTAMNKNNGQHFRVLNKTFQELNIRLQEARNLVLQSAKDSLKEAYFVSKINPAIPVLPSQSSQDNATIVLDVSLSSHPDKFNVWLDLTKALLEKNRTQIKQFNVLLFNVETFWWKETPIANTPSNVDAFIDYAQNLALEGASDISQALHACSNVNWSKNSKDNVFLMSDGGDTWGETDPNVMMKHFDSEDRLFTFNTGLSGTSSDKLAVLSKLGRGALFTITGESEIDKIAQAVKYQPWEIESISVDGIEDFIIDGNLKYVYPNQTLKISGKGELKKGSQFTLNLVSDDQSKSISVPVNQLLRSDLAFRAHGQIATQQLEDFGHYTEKTATAFAKHFGIARQTCSFLMLETDEDYKAFNIKYQEEAYVINSTNLKIKLTELNNELAQLLGNAKLNFQASMEKLEKTMGVEFTIPASMESLIDQLPLTSFELTQSPLNCKVRFIDQIEISSYDSLKRSQLNYDFVSSMAEQRFSKYGSNDALKTLSSLVEKNSGNTVMIRDVAYAAMNWELYSQAYYLFKRAGVSRPYEPQTYIAMGKCLAKMGKYDFASLMFETVLNAEWDSRFGEVHKIASLEYLEVLENAVKDERFILKEYGIQRQKSLSREIDIETADLVVVITWNTDNTDIDLHVLEPSGEECFYSNPQTKLGGRLTQDVTQGYGPEMYVMKDAKGGKYQISANYFSSDRNRTSARTKIYATVYENWGSPLQKKRTKILVLEDNKEKHDIMVVKM